MPFRIEAFLAALALLTPAGALAQEDAPPKMAPSPYDEVGYAGIGFAEKGVAVAHASLPEGSFAEVTSLANGKTILVRVAARLTDGGRLLDLSCAAADQLGITAAPAAVRIRKVQPPEQEQTVLRSGERAALRLAAPESLLGGLRRKLPPMPKAIGFTRGCGAAEQAPPPPAVVERSSPPKGKSVPASPPVEQRPSDEFIVEEAFSPPPPRPKPHWETTPAPRPAGQYAVQIAAVGSRAKADALARSIGGYVEPVGSVFRIRKGPYASEAAARSAVAQMRAKGFAQATMVTNADR